MAAKKTTKKAAEVEEVDEDLELEDLDADVEEDEEKPAKADAVTFGVAHLAEYLSEKTGKKVTTRELRTLIRKMAREDSPRVDREIVAGNRSRYDWPDGLKDPEVKAIVKAVTGGEMEADKKAKLEELKASKAKKTAAGSKGKGKKGKKAPEPEPDDDDDDVEEIEIDDDDE